MNFGTDTLSARAPLVLGALAGLLTCILSAPPALAQTQSPMAEWQYSGGVALESRYINNPPTWQAQFGLGAEELPLYPGSARYRFQPAPTFDIRYRDIAFASLGEGIGVNLSIGHAHRIGAAITYDLGRREHLDEQRLHGLGNINPSPELKLFAEYVIFPLVLRADVRRSFGGYNGWVGDLSAYAPVIGNERFFLMIGPSVTFADGHHQQSYYGITAAQSARSGYAPYSAIGGLSHVSFGANATWFIAHHWLLEGIGAAQRSLGSSDDSPLIEARGQFLAGLFLLYRY
jgi:outer membrane scaffolding protein for murein synthesis (MipA/OmpV family)